MVGPLVVADQRPIGFAARRAELVLVDFLEQHALVELDRAGEVAMQFPLGRIDNPDLEVGARFGIPDQVEQATPTSLQLAETGVVHDFVELRRERGVELLDGLRHGGRQVAVEADGSLVDLLDKRADQILGTVGLGLLGCGNDLIEQAGRCCGRPGQGRNRLKIRHVNFPC